jgi:hypothetical protein
MVKKLRRHEVDAGQGGDRRAPEMPELGGEADA